MNRRPAAALLLVAALILPAGCGGCGRSAPDTPPHPGRKVTWDEYQKMDTEQKDDPYVLDNLDDNAKKKLAGSQRQKKR
jgi:hypothetical protein